MSEASQGQRLNWLLAEAGLESLEAGVAGKFEEYLALLVRWNARVNLTAIRDREGILSRHFVESIVCARALPAGIATLLDFGSGAGFPGIPIALCRPEIAVTLAESQGKKAAFLREAVRTLGISSTAHSGRAETLARKFDCVTLRAVDRMEAAVQAARRLVRSDGWLAMMTTEDEVERLKGLLVAGMSGWQLQKMPGSERRVFALAQVAEIPAP
jgi:16S rRNA (guanine527-N7)-methyltransferase